MGLQGVEPGRPSPKPCCQSCSVCVGECTCVCVEGGHSQKCLTGCQHEARCWENVKGYC